MIDMAILSGKLTLTNRPGTSLRGNTDTSRENGSQDPAAAFTSQSIRPMSQGGRILTGYARPMTSVRNYGDHGSSRTAARSILATSAGHAMSSSGR
jgi:hypothetical protein